MTRSLHVEISQTPIPSRSSVPPLDRHQAAWRRALTQGELSLLIVASGDLNATRKGLTVSSPATNQDLRLLLRDPNGLGALRRQGSRAHSV